MAVATVSSAPVETYIPLRSRRRERGLLVQKLQHLAPAIGLLVEGVQRVAERQRGVGLALACLEIVTSLLLVRTAAREVRAARRAAATPAAAHSRVDWFELFAAAVLALEVVEHWLSRHHWSRPTILLAAITLALALGHRQIAAYRERRRALRFDDAGLRIGGRFFRHLTARWNELARIDLDERSACLVLRSGRRWRIDLADLRNAAEVAAALREARQRVSDAQGSEARVAPEAPAAPPLPARNAAASSPARGADVSSPARDA